MDKVLITNPQQIVDILFDGTNSVEECEHELGIDFAYEADEKVFRADFKWPSKDDDPYDGEPVNQNVWRKREDCILPESYPVVMVYRIGNDFDRFGKVSFRMYEFVSLSDFEGNKAA